MSYEICIRETETGEWIWRVFDAHGNNIGSLPALTEKGAMQAAEYQIECHKKAQKRQEALKPEYFYEVE